MSNAQIPEFVTDEYLRALKVRSGSGTGKEGDWCSLQVYRSWLGLDSSTYEVPDGDSKVVGSYIVAFQDRLVNAGATQEQVYEFVLRHLPSLRGSGRGRKLERRRSYVLSDIMIRELAPLWYELTPELVEHAKILRALPEIVDASSLEKAEAARDAAIAAAWDVRGRWLADLTARVNTALEAKLELRDPILKKAAVAEAVSVAAVAEAEAVAAAAGADLTRLPDESDDAYCWRARSIFYNAFWSSNAYTKLRATVRDALLHQQRETVIKSWALGGQAIERMFTAGKVGT